MNLNDKTNDDLLKHCNANLKRLERANKSLTRAFDTVINNSSIKIKPLYKENLKIGTEAIDAVSEGIKALATRHLNELQMQSNQACIVLFQQYSEEFQDVLTRFKNVQTADTSLSNVLIEESRISLGRQVATSVDAALVLDQHDLVEERQKEIEELATAIAHINEVSKAQLELVKSGDIKLDHILKLHSEHEERVQNEINPEIHQAVQNTEGMLKKICSWFLIVLVFLLCAVLIVLQLGKTISLASSPVMI